MTERGKTIVISLVSEQAAPNAMFLKYWKEVRSKGDGTPTVHLLVTTAAMEQPKARSRNLVDAVLTGEERVELLRFDQGEEDEDVEEVRTTVRQTIEKLGSPGDRVMLNMTGGTKVLALGVWSACMDLERQGWEVEVGYISISPRLSDSIVMLHPKKDTPPLTVKLSIDEYLKAYGIPTVSKKVWRPDGQDGPTFPVEKARTMLELFASPDEERRKRLALFIQDCRRCRGGKARWEDWSEESRGFLKGLLGMEEGRDFHKEETKWLSGDWLEEYLAAALVEMGVPEVWQGVQIEWDRQGGQAGKAKNEIDVMCMHKNRLYVFECKSALAEESDVRSLFNEVVYRLQAMRAFGTGTRRFIVTPDPGILEADRTLREDYRQRAEVFDVRVVTSEELLAADRERLWKRIFG